VCSVDHDSFRRRLAQAAGIADPFRRRMYVLGIVTSALVADGVVPPILVGGGAVDFYTLGGYATQDIDVVIAARDKLDAVLKELGFSKERGQRHWYSKHLDVAIEAPDDTLAGSLERVAVVEVDDLQVQIIGVEDLIMDRLRGYVHWQSISDGEWAGRLIALHEASIDWEYLNYQAEKEGLLEALESVSRACGSS
jgi:hypothetical protein